MPTTRQDVESLRDSNLADNTTGDILASELRDVITIILDYIDTEIPLINTIHTTIVDPSPALGIDGDYAIRPTTQEMWGPKSSGSWGTSYSIKGEQGDPGADGADGAQGPAGPTGATGDDGVGFLSIPATQSSEQVIPGLNDGVHNRPFYQYHQISSISGATSVAHGMGGTALFIKHITAHVQTAPGLFKEVSGFSLNTTNFSWTTPLTGELHVHIIYSR
jgi:hypothetical protein